MQPFDSIALTAVRYELDRLIDARVERIYQPGNDEVVWHLRGKNGKSKLYFSTRLNAARMHLTWRDYEYPKAPPMFCMLLRKHLESMRLIRVEQTDLERVLDIVLEGYDALGDPVEKHFIAEITGKHANLILVEKGIVLGALRPVTPSMSSVRNILPGHPYAPPPPFEGKEDPRKVEHLYAAFAESCSLSDAMTRHYAGLSKLAIAQICDAAQVDPKTPADGLESDAIARLEKTWSNGMHALSEGWFDPRLEKGPKWDYNLWYFGESAPPEQSVSELLDRYYGSLEDTQKIDSRRRQLLNEVKERLERLEQSKAKHEEFLKEADNGEQYRLWGELLTSYSHDVPMGEKSVQLLNYYTGEPIEIKLEPDLTATDNAQRYFKKYQKSKSSHVHHERLLKEIMEEIAYLESIVISLEMAQSPDDLAEIQQEIRPAPPKKQTKGKVEAESEPLHFTSRDGYEIFVGKNNRQNDRLTMKMASPQDWWFHAQYIPGSHVIVKSQGEPLPPSTIEEAASLAAHFSKAKNSTKVPVIYVQRKHLKKPPAAKPGLVIYEREQVINVAPWSE